MPGRLRAAWSALTTTSPRPSEEKASATGRLTWFSQGGVGGYHPWGRDRHAQEGYARNVIAKLCVRTVADAFAVMPLLVFKGDDEARDDHPLRVLLEQPNQLQGKARFLQAVAGHHLISGDTWLEAVRPRPTQPPRELYVHRPQPWEILFGVDGTPRAYRFNGERGGMDFPLDPRTLKGDVLHLAEFNPLPNQQGRGLSPMDVAKRWIDLDNAGADLNITLARGINPSLAISLETGDQETSQNEAIAARTRIEQRLQESRETGVPLITGGKITVQKLADSLQDMQWSEGMHEASRRICAAWGVPHVLVVPGESTYANRETAHLELWEHNVLPFARLLLTDLVPWIRHLYRDETLDLRIDVDAISALEPRRQTVRTDHLAAFKEGVLSLNEVREAWGYEPAEADEDDPANEPAALRNARQASMLADAQANALQNPQPPGGPAGDEDDEGGPPRPGARPPPGPPRLPAPPAKAGAGIKARLAPWQASAPLYASLEVEPRSADAIVAWARAAGLPGVLEANDLHVTTVYSTTPVPLYETDDAARELVPATALGLDVLGPESSRVLVLTVESPLAWQRWQHARQLGATWSWPEYRPHMTVATGVDAIPEGLAPPPFAIEIGPEHAEALDLDPGDTAKSWRTQPRHPAGSRRGGQFGGGGDGGFVPLSGVAGLTAAQRRTDAGLPDLPAAPASKKPYKVGHRVEGAGGTEIHLDNDSGSPGGLVSYTQSVADHFFQGDRARTEAWIDDAITTLAAGSDMQSVTATFQDRRTGGPGFDLTISLSNSMGLSLATAQRTFDSVEKSVHHDYLVIRGTGAGTAKKFLKDSVELYDKAGYETVETDANINVGKYAWAKYGFVPKEADDQDGAIGYATRRATSREDKDAMDRVGRIEDRREQWFAFADTTAGKQSLLQGPSWEGQLRLKDPVSRARFNEYVDRQPGKPVADAPQGWTPMPASDIYNIVQPR